MPDTIVTRAKCDTEHLCDTCQFHMPDCDPEDEFIEFGSGVGNDNVIACATYRPKPKEQA